MARFEDDETEYALSHGWLKYTQDLWYQSRSTRIKIPHNIPSCHDIHIVDISFEEVNDIYQAYITKKNFKDLYNPIKNILDEDKFLGFAVNGKTVAFSKLRHYDNNDFESAMFCWDYKNPKLKLGIRTIYLEMEYGARRGAKYLYIGPGYEKSSIYKKDFDGFEWWTGSEWSTDKTLYEKLCIRDSKSKSFQKIVGIMEAP